MKTTIKTRNTEYVLDGTGTVTAVRDRKTNAEVATHVAIGGHLVASVSPTEHRINLRTPRTGERMMIITRAGRDLFSSPVEHVDGPSLDLRPLGKVA